MVQEVDLETQKRADLGLRNNLLKKNTGSDS